MVHMLDMLLVGLAVVLAAVLLAILASKLGRRSKRNSAKPLLLFESHRRKWSSLGNLIFIVALFGVVGAAFLLPPSTRFGMHKECVIKGNISFSGEHIYHLPMDEYYDETKIDERYGERWFCSEADAVRAGWRRAKV